MSKLQTAAIRYATLGWGVIRLHHVLEDGTCSCRRADCTSIGKHPLDPKGASTPEHDAYQVQHLWEQTPDANIGIVAGTSRLLILDFDTAEAVHRFNQTADADTLALISRAPSVRTGRGIHIYLEDPTGGYSPSVGTNGDAGIDIRAGVSYVVAPPSNHANGTTYEWRREPNNPPEPPTAWLDSYIRNRYEKPARVYEDGDKIIKGSRNNELASIAGSMRRRGLTEAAIRAALIVENETRVDPPLPTSEVEAIARSIASYPPGEVPLTNERHDVATIAKQIEEQGGAPRYAFLTEAQINNLPDIEYLVDGLLPVNGYGVIYGRRSSGKTFEAINLALSVATGQAYRGRTVQKSGVAYIMAEGAAGLKRRLAAWKLHNQQPSLDGFYALPTAVRLNDPELRAHLDIAIGNIPADVRLLVVDTLARSSSGLDENVAADMNKLIGYLDEIRERRGVSVLVVHHSGWDDTHERGSTVIGDAADWICKLKREDEKITVKTEKVKDDELPKPFSVVMQPVDGTDSVVLVEHTEAVATDPRIEALCQLVRENGELTNEDIHALGFNSDTAKKWYQRHRGDFQARQVERVTARLEGRDRVIWRIQTQTPIPIVPEGHWTAPDNDLSGSEAA